jgi:hypothetical protein
MKTQLSFQQAVEAFQRFLTEQKRPSKLHWFFRDDLLLYKRQVFLYWPLPGDNQQLAEELYQIGREKELGMALEVFCFDQDNAYCYVLVPEDEADAGCLMMTELKLSFTTSPHRVWKIRTKWLWRVLQRRLGEHTEWLLELIPFRKAIGFGE